MNPFVFRFDGLTIEFLSLEGRRRGHLLEPHALVRLRERLEEEISLALAQPGTSIYDRVPGNREIVRDRRTGDILELLGDPEEHTFLTWAVVSVVARAINAYLRNWPSVQQTTRVRIDVYDGQTWVHYAAGYIDTPRADDQLTTKLDNGTTAA